MIYIAGMKKECLLLALYKAAKPTEIDNPLIPPEMTLTMAEQLVMHNPSLRFDWVNGRSLKVDISGDKFDPWLYDRDNGEGVAAKAVLEAMLEADGVNVHLDDIHPHVEETLNIDNSTIAAQVYEFNSDVAQNIGSYLKRSLAKDLRIILRTIIDLKSLILKVSTFNQNAEGFVINFEELFNIDMYGLLIFTLRALRHHERANLASAYTGKSIELNIILHLLRYDTPDEGDSIVELIAELRDVTKRLNQLDFDSTMSTQNEISGFSAFWMIYGKICIQDDTLYDPLRGCNLLRPNIPHKEFNMTVPASLPRVMDLLPEVWCSKVFKTIRESIAIFIVD